MNILSRIVIVLVAVVVVVGTVFLATWDIPAPSAPVEKVIPNDTVLG